MLLRRPCRSLLAACAAACLVASARAFSLSMSGTPAGCAAKPFEKKAVAVLGAGGYLGAAAFGFLQRAGSLYGTGISGTGGSPRCLSATSAGSASLNGVLSKSFLLAQADESFVRLADMSSAESIRAKLRGMHAMVLATRCRSEVRPVSSGTYERSPNDKTREVYADMARSGRYSSEDDAEYSRTLFENAVRACADAGLQHVVVVETDANFEDDASTKFYVDTLRSCGVPFTYVRPAGEMENVRDYTYARGVQGDLSIQKVDVENIVESKTAESSSSPIYREDVAACCVQSLLSLDWSESRCLEVSSSGSLAPSNVKRVDREWCVGSADLASKLNRL